MFKKPFRVKSNTQLKGSDTKKLKLKLLKHFPLVSEESLSNFIPNKETVFSVKIISHSGEIVLVYCIQKLPIVFEVNDELFPTVYMLFSFPDLLPVFTTHPQVYRAISGGADLMLPGVVIQGDVNIKSYGKLNKGDHVTVNLTNNKAPIAVGRAALSSRDMYMSGKHGKCVNILHYFGDTLCNLGTTLPLPNLGPVFVEPESNEVNCSDPMETLSQDIGELNLDHTNDNDINNVSDLAVEVESNEVEEGEINIVKINQPNDDIESVDNTEDVNELLMYCFLRTIKTTSKKNPLPVLASTFYKHMLAVCPTGKSLDIKKTKYKKLSSFLNDMTELGIIKLEMVSKGVQSISSISFDHIIFRDFEEKYSIYERIVAQTAVLSQPSNQNIAPEVKEKRTVTAAVLPLFSLYLNKKGDSMTIESVRKCITEYVRVEKLQDEANKKNVRLDKLLKDIVHGDKDSLPWDVLINTIVSKMGFSYELTSGEKKPPTLVKGKLQPIDIQIGSRVGNKKVTLISNLELYGINVNEFAQECQHGVGASTTINNIPSSKSAQVQVQGNQVIFINKLLTEKYNIQKRFIRGLENAPKRKK